MGATNRNYPLFKNFQNGSLVIFKKPTVFFTARRCFLLVVLISSAFFLNCLFRQPKNFIQQETHEPKMLEARNDRKSPIRNFKTKENAIILEEENQSQLNIRFLRKEDTKTEEVKKNQQVAIKKLTRKLKNCKLVDETRRLNKINWMKKIVKAEKKSFQDNFTKEFFNYIAAALSDSPYPGVENYTRYAAAFQGLFPLPNAQPLVPEFGHVVNDVLSFRYHITIPQCKITRVTSSSVFIAVISAAENFTKRAIIRNTWKRSLGTLSEKGSLAVAGFAFVLGTPKSNATQNAIENENLIYGDILQLKIAEFYRNLSLKVAGLLFWLYRNCDRADFILKVDDDIYVNVHNLALFVRVYHQFNHSVFGVGDPKGGWPDREGKWGIAVEEWPWNEYPPYFLGAAVLMHGRTVYPMLAACQTVPMVPFDDLYLFGLCAEKAKIKKHFSSGQSRKTWMLCIYLFNDKIMVSDQDQQKHVELIEQRIPKSAGNATCGRSKLKVGRFDARRKDTKNAKSIEMTTCIHELIKGMASLAHAENYKHKHLQQLNLVESGATFFATMLFANSRLF